MRAFIVLFQTHFLLTFLLESGTIDKNRRFVITVQINAF